MPKYQLYYSPGACSLAVHVLLHELKQDFELIRVDLGKPRDPEFLKLNMKGSVPVLVQDGSPILEGGAILTYLCQEHNSDLIPGEGLPKAKALEALMFCNSTLHPACSQVFKALRIEDAQTRETALKAHLSNVQSLWDLVEKKLVSQPYLAGDKLTVGDILLTVIANWKFGETRPNFGPNTKRLITEVSKRPAYQLALQHEGVEYKAAA